MKDFRVDLKVCEACGALWLRAKGHGVYCRGCALWLSDFPAPRAMSRRAQRRTTVSKMVCAGGAQ